MHSKPHACCKPNETIVVRDAPSRTHRGEQVRAKKALEGLKKQRALSIADMNEAILEVSAKTMRERGAAAPPQPHNLNRNIRSKPDIST